MEITFSILVAHFPRHDSPIHLNMFPNYRYSVYHFSLKLRVSTLTQSLIFKMTSLKIVEVCNFKQEVETFATKYKTIVYCTTLKLSNMIGR